MKYFLSVLLLIGLVSSYSWADDDHERARELVKSGEIMALDQLLQKVIQQQETPLRLLEAELEYESGRLVYELELVDEQGVVRELYFDAKTGEPVSEEDNE